MGVNGIYGLSGSGLDIESMVKVGMMSKQSQYDKMQQNYVKNEWTKAAYVDLYGQVQTFNNSTLSQYKMSSNMNAHSAESSNSDIKATANASAPIMTHYVEVGQAATNAYLVGTNSLERKGDAVSTSTSLKDVLFSNLQNGSESYTKNGVTQKYLTDDDGNNYERDAVAFKFAVSDGTTGKTTSSDSDVATATASASAKAGTHTVDITETASAISLVSNKSFSSTAIKDISFESITQNDDGSYTFANTTDNTNVKETTVAAADLASKTAINFTVGDGTGSSVNISYSYQDVLDGTANLDDIAAKINDAGLNVTASVQNGKFSLTNSEVGSANQITISTPGNSGGNNVGTNSVRLLTGLKFNNSVTGTNLGSFSSNNSYSFAGTDAQGTIDGEAATFSGNNATLNGINVTANGVGETTVTVGEQKTISVTYGQLADGYSFNDLTAAVNNLGQNVKASYDSVNDKFSFYNSESGTANTVTLAMADSSDGGAKAAEFFNGIGLYQSANGELSQAVTFSAGDVSSVSGTNAQVKIDGVEYDLSDNKATVNGVTYNFTGATEGAKSTVTVTQDTEKIIENVKSFIEDYNKLLAGLYETYNEKPNKNYKPLTESQKEGMKDEQIEKWEEKAKAGMLYHDQTLGKLIDEMRNAVSQPIDGIEGKYNSIFAIGISTTGTKGQLTLNEDKLRAALNEDPDAVYNVFAKLDSNDYNDSSKSGIAQRLGDVFNAGMKSIKARSGTDLNTNDDSDLSKLMRELQTKMSNFKAMMNAFEDKLYKKYDSMETMLARLGTQLNYVTSSFS